MAMEFCQASSRFLTRAEGRTTWHGFSFGSHYDPERVGFGALVAHNDEHLPPGTGYPDHPHVDTEIVTFVLSGALRHTSSVGSGVLGPGGVQRLSAGSGVVHAEVSDSDVETRFVQAWVRPEDAGVVPSYVATSVGEGSAGLTCLVGPDGLTIGAAASLWVATLGVGEAVTLPEAPRMHVFAAGALLLGDHALRDGDSAHLVDEGGRELTGDGAGSVALVWAFPG